MECIQMIKKFIIFFSVTAKNVTKYLLTDSTSTKTHLTVNISINTHKQLIIK